MHPTKTMIADAIKRYQIEASPAWVSLSAGGDKPELDRIETHSGTFSTVDCLFDGDATIVLKGDRALSARIFGRFDSRRAEVERIVIAS
jgi:hypothetical protein